MLKAHFQSYQPCVINETINYHLDILDSTLYALDEGFTNGAYSTITSSSLKELSFEILKAVFEKLLSVWDKLQQFFSAYVINTTTVLKKVRAAVVQMDESDFSDMEFRTYEYPKLHQLPVEHKKVINDTMWTGLMTKVVKDKKNLDRREVSDRVDKNINEFASKIFDRNVRLSSSVKEISTNLCVQYMRGQERILALDKEKMLKKIDEIVSYYDTKKEILKTKKELSDYYHTMRKEMMNYFKFDENDSLRILDGDGKVEKIEMLDLSFLKVEINRMLSAYIDIYNIAFSHKLRYTNDIVEQNRTLVMELLKNNKIRYILGNTQKSTTIIT